MSLTLEEQQRLYDALARIANYQTPDDDGMQEDDEDGLTEWGVSREEAIEMAYENVIAEAQWAIRGLRRPGAA